MAALQKKNKMVALAAARDFQKPGELRGATFDTLDVWLLALAFRARCLLIGNEKHVWADFETTKVFLRPNTV